MAGSPKKPEDSAVRLGRDEYAFSDADLVEGHAADEVATLSQARTYWLFGDWQTLGQLDVESLEDHQDRAQFALLAASAHQQMGDSDRARECVRLALGWGCPEGIVARILVAGVHNTLARAAAVKGDKARLARHFDRAVAGVDLNRSHDRSLVVHARTVREMASLGLLPEAAAVLGDQLAAASKQQDVRPEAGRARLKMLETELTLLRQELSLLYTRGAPSPPALEAEDEEPVDERALARRSPSQLGQDLWVLKQSGYKRNGFFVDFGATDGVLLSNTWLLESEFGWRGICAEPNPGFFAELKENRRCTLSSACIGAVTGEVVEFVLADAFGGMVKHMEDDMHGDTRRAYAELPENVVSLRTVSLDDLLRQNDAPHRIDYMSIDTEGSELEILEAFPFDDWDVRLLTVEQNRSEKKFAIRNLLRRHGYDYREVDWEDWYFRTDEPASKA